MQIINNNFFGNLSDAELGDFERANEIDLPISYRQFLLKYNGGQPVHRRNLKPDTYVTYFLGMHNGEHYASIYKHIEMFKKRLPFSTFPIATDPFGNLFIMSVHPDSYGQVFFWDHEGEPEVQDGTYTDNCYFVAYSFDEFLEKLVD